MKYKINSGTSEKTFSVPNALADKYLKLANPKHITVLLWIFRHADTPKSPDELADELKLDKSVVNEAIFFWIDNGLIIPCAQEEDTKPQQIEMETETAELQKKPEKTVKLGSSLASTEEILLRSEESPEYKYLLRKSQEIYGRSISRAEQSMLLSLMDNYGLRTEVILMLISYAVENGKSGTNYIRKAGENWAEEGIETLEDAEEKIERLKSTDKLWKAFCLSIGKPLRKPTEKQEKLFSKWTKEWKFTIEIISEAYEKMLDSIDRPNYRYLDKILTTWHNNGITTLDGIKKYEKSRAVSKNKNQNKDNSGASYSVSDYDNYINNRILNYNSKDES